MDHILSDCNHEWEEHDPILNCEVDLEDMHAIWKDKRVMDFEI
jgi:hypothetical protein